MPDCVCLRMRETRAESGGAGVVIDGRPTSPSICRGHNLCPHASEEVPVVWVAAADGVEKEFSQAHGDRSWDAVADGAPVDAGDRSDLDAGAAEKRLVDDVELGAVDG